VFDNLFAQPLSKSSLVYVLVWSRPPHTLKLLFKMVNYDASLKLH